MIDFEFIRHYFAERADKFVHYRILDREALLSDSYFAEFVRDKLVTDELDDFFAINFPPNNDDNEAVCIDSMDSFSFDLYFVLMFGKMMVSDGGRTFACNADEYEGNGVIAIQFNSVEKYLDENGINCQDHILSKAINKDTFVHDAITLLKVMQTLNNAQPVAPYILELDAAKDLVVALRRAWIENERIDQTVDERHLAIFGNHKAPVNGAFTYENSYIQYDNKHSVVGVFFNSNDEVLVSLSSNGKYDFAIRDFVLAGETDSLESLQRRIEEQLGLGFYFGEIAPSITTTQNRIITDYYIINRYNVSIPECSNKEDVSFDWLGVDEILDLINEDKFNDTSAALMNLIYEMKSK